MIHKYEAIKRIEYIVIDIHKREHFCVYDIESDKATIIVDVLANLRSTRTHKVKDQDMIINSEYAVSIEIKDIIKEDAIRSVDYRGNHTYTLLKNIPELSILG